MCYRNKKWYYEDFTHVLWSSSWASTSANDIRSFPSALLNGAVPQQNAAKEDTKPHTAANLHSLPLSNSSYQLTIDHNSDPYRYFWCIYNDVMNHKVRLPTLDCTYVYGQPRPAVGVCGRGQSTSSLELLRGVRHATCATRKKWLCRRPHTTSRVVVCAGNLNAPNSSSSSDEQSRISIIYYMLYCMGHWWR